MSDPAANPAFSSFVWCLIALAGAGGILAMLTYLASCVRNQQVVHDLKIEISRLQSSYIKQLREQKELQEQSIQLMEEHKRAA